MGVSGPGRVMVVEFAEHGCLLDHLRSHADEGYVNYGDLTLPKRLRIALDIARGMAHLEQVRVRETIATLDCKRL